MQALKTDAVDYCYDFLMELCSPVPVANLIRLAADRESGNPVVG